MSETGNIQVLLLDDHQLVLDGLKLMLDHAFNVEHCASFTSGKDALEYLKTKEADVILSDIEMPGMNGIEFCRQIKKLRPQQKLIALTMLVQHSVILGMEDAGCNGFLIKNSSAEEVIFAIKEVYDGRTYFSKEVIDKKNSGLRRSDTKARIPRLSRREKDIVRLILEQKNTKEIAEELFISVGTVETHRRNIMNKLGTRNAAGLVKFVIENRLI